MKNSSNPNFNTINRPFKSGLGSSALTPFAGSQSGALGLQSLQGSEESQLFGMGTGAFPKQNMTIDINRTSGGLHESLMQANNSNGKGASFLDIETPPVNKTNDRLAQ